MAPSTAFQTTNKPAASPAITQSSFTYHDQKRQAADGHTNCDGQGYCGCLSCYPGNPECITLTNALEDQFSWLCGLTATEITYSYTNLITTGVVEPLLPQVTTTTPTVKVPLFPSEVSEISSSAIVSRPPIIASKPRISSVQSSSPPSSTLGSPSTSPPTSSITSSSPLASSSLTAISPPSNSTSTGAIIGIAIGAVLAAVLLLAGIYVIVRYLRHKRVRQQEQLYPRGTLGGAVMPRTPESERHGNSWAQEKTPPSRKETSPARSFRSKILPAALASRKPFRDNFTESPESMSPTQMEQPHSPELDGSDMIYEMPAIRSSRETGYELDRQRTNLPIRTITPPTPPSNLPSPLHDCDFSHPEPLSLISRSNTVFFHRRESSNPEGVPQYSIPPVSPIASDHSMLSVPGSSSQSQSQSQSQLQSQSQSQSIRIDRDKDRAASLMSARGSWVGYMSPEQALAGGWRDTWEPEGETLRDVVLTPREELIREEHEPVETEAEMSE
ncbi:MAG: hypothetical protein MMC33_001434 [Icmadophila ericetorum]|nr:hypothetical protein [Icmadophila ericetorum]